MSSQLRIGDIDNFEYLKPTDLENMFCVYSAKDGNFIFNLNETLYFDVNGESLPEYICDTPMFWPLASYKIYGTERLAWLLMKINGVRAENMFARIEPGVKIKYADNEFVSDLVKHINGYSSVG